MPLKIVEIEGTQYAVLDAEKRPIYIGEDGETETGYDGEALAARLSEVNGESATRRRELKEANDKLKTFEGIEDPEAAVKALETVKNLEDKKLVDAGEVEKVKNEAIKATEEKHAEWKKNVHEPLEGKLKETEGALHKEMIGGRFAQSKFIAEKIAVPARMVERTFGEHFTIEEGKVICKDTQGNQIYSKSNPGDIADFDEALQLIVEASPDRDLILKGANKGGGNPPGGGGGGGDDKTMTVQQFEEKSFAERQKFLSDGGKLIDDAA